MLHQPLLAGLPAAWILDSLLQVTSMPCITTQALDVGSQPRACLQEQCLDCGAGAKAPLPAARTTRAGGDTGKAAGSVRGNRAQSDAG